jgi:hypothetical protein
MQEPVAGEDCRSLWRYVDQLVSDTNALLNMSGIFEGRIRGVNGIGILRLAGNAAELRIQTLGGDVGQGDQRIFTSLAIRSSHNPSDFGEAVSWTAFVAADATGLILFYLDGVLFAGITVLGGVAVSPSATGLGSGPHSVICAYSGDGRYFPATGTFTQIVRALTPPSVELSSDLNPSVYGNLVVFELQISAINPIPPAPLVTGLVLFNIDGVDTAYREVTRVAGQVFHALFQTNSLGYGPHNILATYLGDDNYGQDSDSLVQVVLRPGVVNVTADRNPVPINETVVFTATVARTGPSAPYPTGTIQFNASGSPIGSPVVLDNQGRAQIALQFLGPGESLIEADYSGDGRYAPGSGSMTETIVDIVVPDWLVFFPGGAGVPSLIAFGVLYNVPIEAQLTGGAHQNITGNVEIYVYGFVNILYSDGSNYSGGLRVSINGGAAIEPPTVFPGTTFEVPLASGFGNYTLAVAPGNGRIPLPGDTVNGLIGFTHYGRVSETLIAPGFFIP